MSRITPDQIKDLIAIVRVHRVKGAAHRLQLTPAAIYKRISRAGLSALVPPHTCAGSTCPCQDGDPCHYEDWQGTEAMARGSALVPPNHKDQGAGLPGSAESRC
jgi:hypothetical protein